VFPQWNNSLALNIYLGTPRDHLLTVKDFRDIACMSNSRGPNYFILGGRG
jgi:hypothetical protein